MEKLVFNLSPSAINLYKTSQLVFYFTKILNLPEDSEVCEVYGLSGNVTHEALEYYVQQREKIDDKVENRKKTLKYFEDNWRKKSLFELESMNGRPLSFSVYKDAVIRGIDLLDNKYTKTEAEEEILFPLIDDERGLISIKGFIDNRIIEGGNLHVLDWKTSSKVDKDDSKFRLQTLHYSYLIYRKYGKVPKSCIIEYIKIGKKVVMNFTEDEINNYGDYLIKLAKEILDKGKNIDLYELGDIEFPWNKHKNKCLEESEKRIKGKKIRIVIQNNKIKFLDKIPPKLKKAMEIKYTYQIDGYQFTPAFKYRGWNGKISLFKKDSLPLPYLNNFQSLLNCFNDYYRDKYFLDIEDKRVNKITQKVYNTTFIENDVILRDYQIKAINTALKEKIGILALGCGAGKTLISTELIKKSNLRTLFLVNRKELLTQTADVLRNYLGVNVGEMVEGNLNISNQITVASVQTIIAILKRNNNTTKRLKLFMYNVQMVIFDEAQNISDSGTYGKVSNELKNLVYSFGLTGTEWRTKNDTLEMNALCGFPIYKKTTAELEKEGYLVPTTCFFVETPYVTYNDEDNYHTLYQEYIAKNDKRNELIVNFVNKNRDKKILVLTRLIDHGIILNEMIENSRLINGKTNTTERAKIFDEFKNSKDIVLVGSTKIFSSGINIPDLDIIINATGHKSSIDTIQIVGRVKRKSEGKIIGYYIDFHDEPLVFRKASKKRKKDLLFHGNKVIDIENIDKINI